MQDCKKIEVVLPWTVNVADDVITPRMFLALHVYTPPSCDVTSVIIRPPRDFTMRLPTRRLEFRFSHVTWGTGFPLTSHCNEAAPVSFTTMDTGGDTIVGAEMDSLGSPLGPWGPWSPLGPEGPWSPWAPLSPRGPCGPWGPGGPCLPGAPGLPRLPLLPFGHRTRAGEATQGQLNFHFDIITTDDFTGIWLLVYILGVAFVTNVHFWNKIKNGWHFGLLVKLGFGRNFAANDLTHSDHPRLITDKIMTIYKSQASFIYEFFFYKELLSKTECISIK